MTKYNQARISLIAAIDEQGGIGKNNNLLFRIPEDLARFKKITLGHPVIMGRKTFESIGKPLPGRSNIVITRNPDYQAIGSIVCNSLEKAITKAKKKDKQEIFIIGGGEIYKQSINLADKLYLTLVKGDYHADTFFPDYSAFSKIIYRKKAQTGKYNYLFLELERG